MMMNEDCVKLCLRSFLYCINLLDDPITWATYLVYLHGGTKKNYENLSRIVQRCI